MCNYDKELEEKIYLLERIDKLFNRINKINIEFNKYIEEKQQEIKKNDLYFYECDKEQRKNLKLLINEYFKKWNKEKRNY